MAETIPYDKFQLQVLLGEVQGYLAELRYIDTAMRYLAEQEASGGERVLKTLLTQKDVHYIEVEFGRTFPFTKTYEVSRDWFDGPFDDTREERIRARLAELATEADEWAAAEIEIDYAQAGVAQGLDHFGKAPEGNAETLKVKNL